MTPKYIITILFLWHHPLKQQVLVDFQLKNSIGNFGASGNLLYITHTQKMTKFDSILLYNSFPHR